MTCALCTCQCLQTDHGRSSSATKGSLLAAEFQCVGLVRSCYWPTRTGDSTSSTANSGRPRVRGSDDASVVPRPPGRCFQRGFGCGARTLQRGAPPEGMPHDRACGSQHRTAPASNSQHSSWPHASTHYKNFADTWQSDSVTGWWKEIHAQVSMTYQKYIMSRHSFFDPRNRHTSTILIRHGCAGRVMSITRAPCKHLLHPSSSVACHRGFPFSSWIHSYVGFVSWPNLTLNPITNLLLHHILRPFTWRPITYHNFKSDEPNNHFNKNQPRFLFCLKPAQC